MLRSYTPYLGLLTVDPEDEKLTKGDTQQLFVSNLLALDTTCHTLDERMQAYANAGYMPVRPVALTGSEEILHLENASTKYDIPALLRQSASGTFVRITNFSTTLNTVAALEELYHLLRTMQGIDAGGKGISKAQMHGRIRLLGSGNDKITVSGADLIPWQEDFPSIAIVPQRIENKVYYKSYDGTELLYTETLATETIYDDGTATYPDATYATVPVKVSPNPAYMYSFNGWSSSPQSSVADAVLTAVSGDMTVYAAYAYVRDVAPTFSMESYSTTVGVPATATLTSWGAYDKITALTALDASGNTITANPGGGILTVTANESNGETVTTVTVTPNETFFNAHDWALMFSDTSGSCTRSVPFNLRNLPVLTVTKKSSGTGDSAEITVRSWGSYPNLDSFTCTYQNAD